MRVIAWQSLKALSPMAMTGRPSSVAGSFTSPFSTPSYLVMVSLLSLAVYAKAGTGVFRSDNSTAPTTTRKSSSHRIAPPCRDWLGTAISADFQICPNRMVAFIAPPVTDGA